MTVTSPTPQRRAEFLSEGDRFAAEMTHEIRNTLAAIRGSGEILLDDYPPGHPKAEFLSILLRETRHLHRLAEVFLAHARGLAQRPARSPVDLSRVVAEASAAVGCCAMARRIQFCAQPCVGAVVWGEPDPLRHLVSNLLRNAVQAAPPASTVRAVIDLPAPGEGEDGTVRLRVEDEGPGIPEAVLPLLFEPFLTTKAGGTGIGLALGRQVARAHGGDLTAENRRPSGARFVLILPRWRRRGTRAVGRRGPPVPAGRPERRPGTSWSDVPNSGEPAEREGTDV